MTHSCEIRIVASGIFDKLLDYLTFEFEGQSAKVNIKDRELLRRFEEIDKLSEKTKDPSRRSWIPVSWKTNFKTWLPLSSCKGGRKKMNKAAITKHDIYNKLIGFTEQDLSAIANFEDIKVKGGSGNTIQDNSYTADYNISDFMLLKGFEYVL